LAAAVKHQEVVTVVVRESVEIRRDVRIVVIGARFHPSDPIGRRLLVEMTSSALAGPSGGHHDAITVLYEGVEKCIGVDRVNVFGHLVAPDEVEAPLEVNGAIQVDVLNKLRNWRGSESGDGPFQPNTFKSPPRHVSEGFTCPAADIQEAPGSPSIEDGIQHMPWQ
jgi:hypothetical protein